MTKDDIDRGLAEVSGRLSKEMAIVVSGSAALLLGEHIQREAGDCDVGDLTPDSSESALVNAGNQVGQELSYAENWLNTSSMAWQGDFPQGWRTRVVRYRDLGRLCVSLMSRVDCVSMLLLRIMHKDPERDLADIAQIPLTAEERSLLLSHTRQLEKLGFEMSPVQIAFHLL